MTGMKSVCLLTTRAQSNYCVKKRSEARNGRDSRLSSTQCLNSSFQLEVLRTQEKTALTSKRQYYNPVLLLPKDLLCHNPCSERQFVNQFFGGKQAGIKKQHKISYHKHCIYRTQLKFPFFVQYLPHFLNKKTRDVLLPSQRANLKTLFSVQHTIQQAYKSLPECKNFGEIRHSNSVV